MEMTDNRSAQTLSRATPRHAAPSQTAAGIALNSSLNCGGVAPPRVLAGNETVPSSARIFKARLWFKRALPKSFSVANSINFYPRVPACRRACQHGQGGASRGVVGTGPSMALVSVPKYTADS